MTPNIDLGQPNSPIQLYSGPIEFDQDGKAFTADATVSLTWLPSPSIRFKVPSVPASAFPKTGRLTLRLNDGTVITHGLVTELNHSSGPEGFRASLSGIVAQRVTQPADGAAACAQFFLPNFDAPAGDVIAYLDGSSRTARLALAAGGWKFVLDEVENDKEVERFLRANSGFAFTQVGRLEREDGKPFTAEEALPALDSLGWYVSFCCGRWTWPCLPRGYDKAGTLVWQVWDAHRTVPYRRHLSWVDPLHREHFELPFPGFLRLWLDSEWEEVIRVSIHWYVEANAQAGSIEGAIVLTQTAFELLSSAILVEHYAWLSTDGYEKLTAADRIRLLFLWAGIPVAIPAELSELTKLAKADNWADSSTAMTAIRNTITHPTRKNREKFGRHPNRARTDVWKLGLWNLELCLLRLFEYRGTYGSRLKQRFQGEVVPVPWAPSPPP